MGILEAKRVLMEKEQNKEWVEQQENMQQDDGNEVTKILLTPKRTSVKRLKRRMGTSDQSLEDEDSKEDNGNKESEVAKELSPTLVAALGKISEEECKLMQ